MKWRVTLLWLTAFCCGSAAAQLGGNCGEHQNILRNQSGIVWFTPEQLRKMAVKRAEPETPSELAGFHFQGYVSFKILVDKDGQIGCIWNQVGNPVFGKAANEALQYWTFRPMIVKGRPVEYVGTIKFHFSVD